MAEMRAAQSKDVLLSLVELGSDRASRILADVPGRSLRLIDRASAFDWIPIEIDLDLCRIVQAAAGEEGIRAWGRAAVLRTIESSLFRPLVDTSIRVFGLTPVTLLRLAPLIWRSTFRGAGQITVKLTAPRTATVQTAGLPAAMRERAFLHSIAGSLEAAFELAGDAGTILLVDPPDGEPRFVATWTGRP
jgi:hypothetical protein